MIFRRRPDPRDTVIAHQAKQIQDLLDRLQELIGQIHLHQVERAQAEVAGEARKMHVSEEEDEILWRKGEGLIDARAAEDLLKQLDFDNSELDINY